MLNDEMRNFYGTEHYYRYMNTPLVYTDGVKYFAEKAGAYWFIDLCVSHLIRLHDDFYLIRLKVENEKAIVTFERDEEICSEQKIAYTDCPEGEWVFFFYNNVLMWNMEY